MPQPVLVIEHAPWETPGLVTRVLRSAGVETRTVVHHAGAAPPSVRHRDGRPDPVLAEPARQWAGIVVMGGPQTADDGALATLAAERALLARAVGDGVPVLGICLGMQLLALALGAPLHREHGTEIGFGPVQLTQEGREDPLLAPLTGEGTAPVVLHWHSDAVGLPAGARLLASSAATPVQAFRVGLAVGLQFHLEVDAPLLAEWLTTDEMVAGLDDAHVEQITRDGERHLPGLAAAAVVGLGAFADDVRARRG